MTDAVAVEATVCRDQCQTNMPSEWMKTRAAKLAALIRKMCQTTAGAKASGLSGSSDPAQYRPNSNATKAATNGRLTASGAGRWVDKALAARIESVAERPIATPQAPESQVQGYPRTP